MSGSRWVSGRTWPWRTPGYDAQHPAKPFFAFIYNSLGVPLAAGALYPAFGLLLSPVFASAAMTFSSVSVITNALRLRKLAL